MDEAHIGYNLDDLSDIPGTTIFTAHSVDRRAKRALLAG